MAVMPLMALVTWYAQIIHIFGFWYIYGISMVAGWAPLKNDGVKVRWDDDIPNDSQLNGQIKAMFQTTNQLATSIYGNPHMVSDVLIFLVQETGVISPELCFSPSPFNMMQYDAMIWAHVPSWTSPHFFSLNGQLAHESRLWNQLPGWGRSPE